MDQLQYERGGNGGAAAGSGCNGGGGDGGGRVVHPRRDPDRLVNRFQPGHKFLEQLANKSPMSLVNEVARYHNFKAEYILLDCIGPSHSKVYRVELHFGSFEKFLGDGNSMKAAQRNAAVAALQNTQFGFPRVHYGGIQQTTGIPWNGSSVIQTPASELNTLMMKKGIQPKYELTAEKQIFNDAEDCSQYHPEYETFHFTNQAQHYCPPGMIKPPLLPSPDYHHHKSPHSLNGKMYPNVEASKVGWYSPIAQQMAPAFGHPNGYFVPPQPLQPYMYQQSAAYMRPNYHSSSSSSSYPSSFLYRAPISSHYSSPCNSNSDYSPAHHSYQHSKHSTADKWNLYPVSSYIPPAQTNKFNSMTTTNYEAKLEIDGQQFTGQGRTVQAARHSAANEALKVVKAQSSLQKSSPVQANQKSASLANPEADEPSPVSLVYEYASRKRFEVLFETIRESGQVHLRSFLMRCSLFTDASKQPFLSANGEDRSKKTAKRAAAQAILDALKEKDTDSFKKDALSSINKVFPSPKVKLSVISSEQQHQKQHKKQQQEKPKVEQQSAEECTSESAISCRFVTLLYDLTRNMTITHPVYLLSTVPETDSQLIESFKAALGDNKGEQKQQQQKQKQQSSEEKWVLHKVECSVTFEQRLPEQTTCQVAATGYGSSARIAKSIATYICLQKLGVALPPIDFADSSSSTVLKTLNFSLTRNLNVPEAVRPFVDEISGSSAELLIKSATACIEQNLQFIIHILGKLYLFTLKNSTKSLECIFAKLETSLMTFYATKYPAVAASEVAIKCALLEKCVDSLPNRKLYWSHLELISALVLLGVNTDKLQNTDEKRPLLHFKSHFLSTSNKGDSSSPLYVSIITGHCDATLASTFNFSLIKKNFINFGLGCSEEAAREMASYWILKNLAYQARKQIIDNEYVETTDVQLPSSTSTAGSQHRSALPSTPSSANKSLAPVICNGNKSSLSPGVAKSRSKSLSASHNQLISKECIGHLYRAASELNIRKPFFKSETLSLAVGATIANPEGVSLARELLLTCCSLTFIQEVPDQLTTRVTTYAIAPSHRIGRTICAYLALCKLGVANSLQTIAPKLYTADDFATYLRLTQCNGALFPTQHCASHSSLVQPLEQQVDPEVMHMMRVNAEEIGRNLDFVTHILQEVYRPFLKNQKMSCPGLLLGRIERELFEYHNRQQQIMDESTAFDRCSAHIEKCIGELVRQYDGTQFWDHLQLLSSIAALLTANLAQPLVPSPLHFNCSLSKCAEFSLIKQQTPVANGQQTQQQQQQLQQLSSSTASISVAIVTVSSVMPGCSQAPKLAQKSCLSFSLGETGPLARERAAYKALRQLAINLWK